MSDTPAVVETNDDLDAFEAVFFNKEAPAKETIKAEEPVIDETTDTEEPTSDEATEDTDEDTVAEDEETESEDPEEDAEEPAPTGKKNRKSFQERINELTAKAKEAERREADIAQRFADLEAKLTPKEAPKKEEGKLPDGAPDPNSENEKGEDKYPLGEFDPAYIRDLTRFTIQREHAAAEAARTERAQQEAAESARKAQTEVWVARLDEAEKDLPDVRDKILSLESAFANIDAGYGQYLVDVVMSLEAGPKILHYLGEHPKEAREIVSSGPAGATLALGRLDAKMARVKTSPEAAPKKVSKAPEPPAKITRGSGGKFATMPDTDDLDAFEKQFYNRK